MPRDRTNMVIVTRRRNEAIVVGEVTVTVVDIRDDRVRLGIEAPIEVPVHRFEVWESMRRSAAAAAPERATLAGKPHSVAAENRDATEQAPPRPPETDMFLP